MFVDLSHYHFPIFLDFPLLLLGPHLPPVLGWLNIRIKTDKNHLSTVTGSYVVDQIILQFAAVAAICTFEILKKENFHQKKFSSQVADIAIWMNGTPAEFAIPLVGSKMSISASADLLNLLNFWFFAIPLIGSNTSISATADLLNGWYDRRRQGWYC